MLWSVDAPHIEIARKTYSYLLNTARPPVAAITGIATSPASKYVPSKLWASTDVDRRGRSHIHLRENGIGRKDGVRAVPRGPGVGRLRRKRCITPKIGDQVLSSKRRQVDTGNGRWPKSKKAKPASISD